MGNHSTAVPTVEVDPVSALLDGTYLPNWSATEMRLSGDWGLSVPSDRGCLYVIIRGGGWFKATGNGTTGNGTTGNGATGNGATGNGATGNGAAPIHLVAGDHLVVTRGIAHELLSEPTSPSAPVDSLLGEPLLLPKLDDGTFSLAPIDSESTVLLYGQFEISEGTRNPLDVGLPDLVRRNHRDDLSLSLCLPMVTMIQSCRRERPPGWKVVVRRLTELVLFQTVAGELTRRAQDRNGSGSESGEFRMMKAITDAVVGPVLRVMVDTPSAAWTVPQMARLAKVSKSSFSERFRKLVGLPPLQYLTEIRMDKSRRLLRESDVDVSEIAIMVGYESPSSFSNVFKRWHGQSPIEFRRQAKRERQAK